MTFGINGDDLEAAITRLFAKPDAAYLHTHIAAPGVLSRAPRAGLRQA
jgi:hypothetical protein